MIYLSGAVVPSMVDRPRPDLGVMLNPQTGNRAWLRAGLPWAADNGCFVAGETFDADAWLAWLGGLRPHAETCLFAVAPDVVGDAAATLARSSPHLPTIRRLGFRAPFVSQDGADRVGVPWDAFDCLFVGGSTAWKLSEPSYGLGAEAKARGKWLHMGRVSGARRLHAARVSGVDSTDGTKLKFGPDKNLRLVHAWLDALRAQTVMELTW